jgi:hypothetical protein
MRVVNTSLLDGYAQASGGTVTTATWNVQHFNGFSIQVTVSSQSSYGATAKLQASDDNGRDFNGTGVSNWVDLANSGATANLSLAANGSYMWNVDGTFYKWIRASITASAGSATLDVRGNGKGPSSE